MKENDGDVLRRIGEFPVCGFPPCIKLIDLLLLVAVVVVADDDFDAGDVRGDLSDKDL